MTFKVCNLGSKQPYFNRAYVVRVPIFSFTTVSPTFKKCNFGSKQPYFNSSYVVRVLSFFSGLYLSILIKYNKFIYIGR